MINLDKPTTGQAQTDLLIGSGYKLLIGGIFNLILTPANTLSGMTNGTRPGQGETWGTIASTWATETRTWLAVSQLIANNAKPVTSLSNLSKP